MREVKKSLKMRYHFKIVLHFMFILGKFDFSFAAEYCLISHKSSDIEKRLRKYISGILIYFHEICLHVFFNNYKFFFVTN